ncbi:MAG: phage tail tape measure protein [Hamadaea sp.]|nr:phage tail tape measure protein [Hamadaea sp.]
MALSRDLVIRLLGDADSAVKAQKAAADAAEVSVAAYRKAEREYARQQAAMETASAKQRVAMEKVGRGATVMGATILAGIGVAVKAAIDWESAWTGVTKTVSGSPKQLAEVEKGLRNLARTLPSTHQEIAAVAEAAGQLGIAAPNIVAFTKTMIDLGQTTNLSAEDAATSLAQLMNIMQTSPKDVGRLGASLVALGNAGASTESDIVNLAQRLAGAGRLVGASESDVLALANAMSSMGINAELGGGVMTRVLQKIYSAVKEGGASLQGFADVAGMSSKEFAAAFQKDPIRAVDAFVKGLNTVDQSGGNVVKTLGNLGLKGTEEATVLLSLKGAGDLLNESLNLGNKAWQDNTALIQEAAKRYDTTESKIAMARNALNDAAIEIGDTFLPALASMAGGIADVAKWFADLPRPVKEVLGGLGAVAGTVGVLGGALLLVVPRVVETYKAFQALQSSSSGLAQGLGKVGKAAGIASVVAALSYSVGGLVDSLKDAPPTMEATTKALLGMRDGMEGVNKLVSSHGTDVFASGIKDVAGAARSLTDPSLLNRFDDFGAALTHVVTFGGLGSFEGRAERDQLISQFDQIGKSLGVMVQSGNADQAAAIFAQLSEEWKKGGGNVKDLKALLPDYTKALDAASNGQDIAGQAAAAQAQATAALAADLGTAYASLTNYAAAIGLSDDDAKQFIQNAQDMGKSLADFVTPLDTYKQQLQDKAQAEADSFNKLHEGTSAGTKSWQDFADNVKVSLDKYLADLEGQVKAQQDWQVNMLMLAGRVSQGTIDELARMGPEGAPLVAQLVNASDSELARFETVTAARSQAATDAWGAQLTLAAPVLAEVAKKAGKGVSDSLAAQLQAGTITVAQIAAQYGVVLAQGVNPVLTALGKTRVVVGGFTRPGQIGINADGNLYENHQAEIAPGGAMRLWAEPETGGEAYIPLHPSKRARSLNIWQETGRRLQAFANGGFAVPEDVPHPPSTSPYNAPLSTAGDAAMDSEYQATTQFLRENGPIGRALAWAKTQVGKPYIWGAAGPQGYDCSGFMSAITNVLLGRSPYSRVGSTANFPWPGFLKGDGAFTIGSTPDSGDGIGHMAGTLHGVNVESRGGQGVVVGGSARGAHDGLFRTRAHLGAVFHSGTEFVPRTGWAFLERGEKIIPREANRGVAVGAASVGSRPGGGVAAAPISVAPPVVKVYLDGQEWRGMARVEAEGVVVDYAQASYYRGEYNG